MEAPDRAVMVSAVEPKDRQALDRRRITAEVYGETGSQFAVRAAEYGMTVAEARDAI